MGNRTALAYVGLSLGVVFGCGDDDPTTAGTSGAGNSGAIGAGGVGNGGEGQGGQAASGGTGAGGSGGAGGESNPGHVWSQRFGDRVVDKMTRVGVSSAGDVVLTGRYAGDIDIGGTPLMATAGQNVFVASLDSEGTASWAKGLGDLFVWDLDFDSAGNVLLSGQSLAPNDLGGGPLPPKSDAFIVKYAPDGSHLLTKPFLDLLPISFVYPSYLAVDGNDDIVMGGTFSGTVNFGDGAKTADGFDCWIVKLDSAGALIWSRTFGGTNAESIRDITTDDAGGVIAVGEFLGTLSAGGAVHTAAGTPSLFVVKYDASGALVESHGYASDVRTEMSVVADGTDFVVAGGFQGSIELEGGSPMDSMGGHDVFIARYDATGAIVDAKRFGSAMNDYGAHLARDASGSLWLTGQIGASVDFGGGAVGAPAAGMFLASFDAALGHLYSGGFGDMEEQAGVSLGADPISGLVVGATGEGAMNFGGGDLVSAGMSDVFVAKLDP